MKAVVPEIAWHNKNPVFTVDIQLNVDKGFYRAATGGGDSHVVIWHLVLNEFSNEVTANFAADLDRHIKAVNVVRFSKDGEFLASGDDDAIIVIWALRDSQNNATSNFNNDEINKENWVSVKTLRGHKDDIYDVCWSPFSNEFLLSGSVDNTAIIWNVDKATNTGTLGEHGGFVQGVAWDPKGKCLATLSSDRALRIFDASSRKLISKLSKTKHSKPSGQDSLDDNFIRLFHDDTVKTFFRRLNFSPDGHLLFVPCGIYRENENEVKPPKDVTYVFLKNRPDKPVLHFPSPDEYTIAVKCCPILFELNPTDSNVFDLPYRIIFAIATRRSIVFYDTQQLAPFGFITDIHYATLTDISWSGDGRILLASSSDGYCTIVTFREGELGNPYVNIQEQNKSSVIRPMNDENKAEKEVEILLETTKEAKEKCAAIYVEKPQKEMNEAENKRPESAATVELLHNHTTFPQPSGIQMEKSETEMKPHKSDLRSIVEDGKSESDAQNTLESACDPISKYNKSLIEEKANEKLSCVTAMDIDETTAESNFAEKDGAVLTMEVEVAETNTPIVRSETKTIEEKAQTEGS